MKHALLKEQSLNTDVAALLLRLIFGGLFIRYGLVKFLSFTEILPYFGDIIGIGSKLSFILVIIAELGGGILITLGLFTRLAVIPVFIAMTIAFFIAHTNDAFDAKTLPFLYMLLSFVVFILGSGKYFIDHLLFSKRSSGVVMA